MYYNNLIWLYSTLKKAFTESGLRYVLSNMNKGKMSYFLLQQDLAVIYRTKIFQGFFKTLDWPQSRDNTNYLGYCNSENSIWTKYRLEGKEWEKQLSKNSCLIICLSKTRRYVGWWKTVYYSLKIQVAKIDFRHKVFLWRQCPAEGRIKGVA